MDIGDGLQETMLYETRPKFGRTRARLHGRGAGPTFRVRGAAHVTADLNPPEHAGWKLVDVH